MATFQRSFRAEYEENFVQINQHKALSARNTILSAIYIITLFIFCNISHVQYAVTIKLASETPNAEIALDIVEIRDAIFVFFLIRYFVLKQYYRNLYK